MSHLKNISKTRDFWDQLAKYDSTASVIDPNDKKGYKNLYIRSLITKILFDTLDNIPMNSMVLDFGCGTGQNFPTMEALSLNTIGLDISHSLLLQAKNNWRQTSATCIQYDGIHIPLREESIWSTITYVVLNYLIDDQEMTRCLTEVNRVMKPNGIFIAIEQTTRKHRTNYNEMKCQRTQEEFIDLFNKSGFTCISRRSVRRGHFPLIYAIRYGLIPKKFFPFCAFLESLIGKILPTPLFDYADTVFILKKDNMLPHNRS